MRKAYKAAPLIVIAMAGMIIFYLIMIYPTERAELLGYLHNNTSIGQQYIHTRSVTPGAIVDTYSSIGYVGQAMGQELDKIVISKVDLEYPLVKTQKKTVSSFVLTSNILRATPYETYVDIEPSASSAEVEIDIGDVSGTPKLIVEFNGNTIFYSSVQSGEKLKIKVPKSMLSAVNTLTLRSKFVGVNIFSTQTITVQEVRVYSIMYDPLRAKDSYYRDLSVDPKGFGSMVLSFGTTSLGEAAKVKITLNGKTIFNKVPNELESMRSGLVGIPLRKTNNLITFETEKGGVYTLDNVKFSFYAEKTGRAQQKIVFDVPADVFAYDKNVTITAYIGEVLIPGTLEFNLEYPGVSYIADISSKPGPVTVQIEDPQTELRPYGNLLILDSPDGRFRVDKIEIKVEDVE